MTPPLHTRPLRRHLILALLAIIAMALLLDRVYEYAVVRAREIERDRLTEAREMSYTLSRDYSQLLTAHQLRELRQSVAAHATHNLVERLTVTDPDGLILASTRLSDLGKPLGQVTALFQPSLFRGATGENRILVSLSPDRQAILAYAPVSLPPAAGELRALRHGLLFIQLDIASLKAASWAGLFSAESLLRWLLTFALASLLLVYLLNRRLLRPLRHLEEVTRRFGQGDWDAHASLTGQGELAHLGETFNNMRGHLLADREALQASESRFRALVETSPMAMLVTSPPPESRVLLMNQRFTELFGYQLADIPDIEAWWPLAYPDLHYRRQVRQRWETAIATMREAGQSRIAPVSAKVSRADGSTCFVEAHMTVQGDRSLVVFNDLTERRANEEELRRHRHHLEELVTERTRQLAAAEADARLLLESTADGLYGIDAEGRLTFVNPAACRMLGYRSEQLIGLSSHHLFHHHRPDGSPYPDHACPTRATLREGQVRSVSDEVFWRADGQPIPVIYATHPMQRDGRIIGAVVSFMDISDRKRFETELRAAKEAAESANRAKSVFLANMSHELRTPLNAILGFAQLMARDERIPEAQRRNLAIINRSGQHLLNLINDVLEISRIESGRLELHRQPFDLTELLAEVMEAVEPRARQKGLGLRQERDPDLPHRLDSVPGKLRQILLNLLSNAIKYTQRGEVVLATQRAADGIRTALIFTVRDTGIGIPSEELQRIFQPFYQTEAGIQQGEGTGLGLAICRQYAALLEGEMEAESVPGVGSVFRLRLPLDTAADTGIRATPPAPPPPLIELAPDQPAYRILVAEDNPDNRLLLESLLAGVGYQVRSAADGRQAVELFQAWHPDFVWMDMRMPVMDGYEASRRIRALDGRVPLVALTASAFEEDQVAIRAAGCDAVVKKPLDTREILDITAARLGARYRFAGPEAPTSHPLPDGERLARLPVDLRQHLRESAMELDTDRLAASLDAVAGLDPELADSLRELAAEYRYDQILRLIEPEPTAPTPAPG